MQKKLEQLPDEVINRIGLFLGRMQREVVEEQKMRIEGEFEINLSQDEAELLEFLEAEGVIKSPPGYIPMGPKSSPASMTAHGFSKLVQSFTTEDNKFPVNICFKNITYEVDIPLEDPGINTVWKTIAGALGAFNIFSKHPKKTRKILNDLSGVFKAGTTTIVLGPRSSGITSMFKALADSLVLGAGSELSGQILYSGYSASELMIRKFCMYVDEADLHIPTLTVQETLDFAFKCFGGENSVYGIPTEELFPSKDSHSLSMAEVLSGYVGFLLRQMGLENCKDAIAGNEVLRGISGGEKRRLTSAEMLVARKPLMFFDQLSTGLDSAATFDIIRDLKTQAMNLSNTYIISLLQPAPEVYNLFDEVLILAEGMILYHGKREMVLPFFDSIGYHCPPEQDIADFIQEVTTDLREKFLANGKIDRKEIPTSNYEIAKAWSKSHFARPKNDEIEEFSSEDVRVDNKLANLLKNGEKKFSNGFFTEVKLIFGRERKLLYRNKPLLIARLLQSSILGIFLGTVFFNLPTELNDAAPVQQRYGLVFFLVLQSVLSVFAIIPEVFETREIFYKQSNYYFHRVFAYACSSVLVGIPFSILEALILAGITIPLTQLIPLGEEGAAASFFAIVMFMVLGANVLSSMLRVIASVVPNQAVGLVFTGFLVSIMVLFSGFVITYDNIPPWFVWIYWITPISYVIRSIIIIVFSSVAFSDEETEFALGLFNMETDVNYIWYGFVFLIVMFILNTFLITAGLSFFRYDVAKKRREIKEDLELEAKAKGTTKLFFSRIRRTMSRKLWSDNTEFSQELAGGSVQKSTQITEVGELLGSTEFTAVCLVFKDLKYTVPIGKHESKTLLQGISGYALPGTMTALMGSSGAGKTTLMDVIAGRKTAGTMEGEILVNGQPKEKSFARMMGYVEQMDVHSPHQTIEEAIRFSATLRQRHSTPELLEEFVDTVLQTLELTKIRSFEIGIRSQGGISAEQAKRVTIAVELAANPSVLFLDEPTSGLDSRAADVIMRGMKRVAQSGRTIVCTIHQPNRTIFESFDRMLLLQRGGSTVYFGDLGVHSQDLVGYLEAIDGCKKLPNARYNPANYMLEAIGAGTSSSDQNDIDFKAEYDNSKLRALNDETIETSIAESKHSQSGGEEHESSYATSIGTQLIMLMTRTMKSYWRNPSYVLTRYILMVIMGLLWGTTYYDIANPNSTDFDQSGAISIMGVLFSALAFLGAFGANLCVEPAFIEKSAFMRERASGMYNPMPYVLSIFLTEIPYIFIGCLTFSAVLLFLMGFDPSAETFFQFVTLYFLFNASMVLLGHMMTSLFFNVTTPPILIGLLMSVFVIFSGFLIAVDDVSPFWKFMTYVSPAKYAFHGITEVLMLCNCESVEVINVGCDDKSIGCSLVETQLDGQFLNVTAWDLLKGIYTFEDDQHFQSNSLTLLCYWIFYVVCAFLGYTFLAKPRR